MRGMEGGGVEGEEECNRERASEQAGERGRVSVHCTRSVQLLSREEARGRERDAERKRPSSS